ncbi:MAG: hypothetical protein LC799_12855 [Actinobacteria bacterium]|nr:hypothetical protein [Actinomycetota bacterium]
MSRWRTGRKVGRTIYLQQGDEPSDDDQLIGLMDTPELARQVVDAVNTPKHHWRASTDSTYGAAPLTASSRLDERQDLQVIPTQAARATRSVVVRIEALPGGLMRLSVPEAQGWGAAARTPAELARAVAAAFVEHDIAAYASRQGRVYDGAGTELGVDARGGQPRPSRPDRKTGDRRRSDTYDPAAWRLDDLGRLVSPSGKRAYPATSWVAQRVMEQRQAMGLPALPGEDGAPRGRTDGLRGRGAAS